MKKGLLILGCGGQGKIAYDCAQFLDNYKKIAFMADTLPDSPPFFDALVFNDDPKDYSALQKEYPDIFIAIGNNAIRLEKSVFFMKLGFNLATLIHPMAYVSPYAKIGKGSIICVNAVVNTFAEIGISNIINTSAVIEHDCKLDDGVHISPNCSIAGNVKIGTKTWVGIGSCIINNLNIGNNCIIAAGSTVTQNIPNNVLAAGTPAVIKKQI